MSHSPVRYAVTVATFASLATFGAVFNEGDLAYAEDTKLAYTYTGGVWSPAGSNEAVCNVMLFGALGDGVHDDTAAIQAAIVAAASSKLPVYFPPGVYSVVPPGGLGGHVFDVTQSNLTFQGAGREASTIKSAIGSGDGHFVFFVSGNDVTFQDLGFDAAAATGSSKPIAFNVAAQGAVRRCLMQAKFGWGVFVGGSSNIVVEETTVLGTTPVSGSHCIEINGSNNCTVDRCLLQNSAVGGAGIEIYDPGAGATPQPVGNRVVNTDIVSPGNTGINIVGVTGTFVDNCSITGAGNYGIRVDCSELDHTRLAINNTFSNVRVTGSALAGIVEGINAGSVGSVYAHCDVSSSGQSGMVINGGTGIQIVGGTYKLNQQSGIVINASSTYCTLHGVVAFDNSQGGRGASSAIVSYGTFISMFGCTAYDSKAAPNNMQDRGIYIQAGASNNHIVGCASYGTVNYPWYVNAGTGTETIGTYGSSIDQPAVAGSRAGNAALASLLTALANMGLIVDNTSA